jgi:hypothetical protein
MGIFNQARLSADRIRIIVMFMLEYIKINYIFLRNIRIINNSEKIIINFTLFFNSESKITTKALTL